jgi:hypothetical protein
MRAPVHMKALGQTHAVSWRPAHDSSLFHAAGRDPEATTQVPEKPTLNASGDSVEYYYCTVLCSYTTSHTVAIPLLL